MKRIFLPALLVLWASVVPARAAAPAMKSYTIDLPNHILRFSLPEEIVQGELPFKVVDPFDPQDPSFIKNGFYEIVGALYDVKGPFWVGAYGSLELHFIVQKRNAAIGGDITTIEGLERYVPQWVERVHGRSEKRTFSRASLHGMATIERAESTFGDTTELEPEEMEIFSLPLDEEMFLDVGFTVMGWEGGHGKEAKWKPKAEAMREKIKATVVLEPKE
jgi:hypothetical protein